MLLSPNLDAFVAILERGSFEQAAAELRITQSAVSQRIRSLEEQIGSPLLIREKPIRPTRSGEHLLRFARQTAALEGDLAEQLSGNRDGWQELRIAVNNDSLDTWLFEALGPLLKKEGLLLKVWTTDEGRTDELLRAGTVAAAVTTRKEPSAGCEAHRIGSLRYHCVSTPTFAERSFPNGIEKNALRTAPYVNFDENDTLHHEWLWKYFRLKPHGIPFTLMPSPQGFIDLTKLGTTYSLCPWQKVKDLIDQEVLCDLTPEKTITRALYWHCWHHQSAALQQATEAIRSFAKGNHSANIG
ncbi:LysR family transcriptional regulator ArgP [bacterium]|nr:LysR family transcriptional regulator ArgP [bacterium]